MKHKATPPQATEHKSVPVLGFKVLDEDQGICEELAAGIGNIDFGRDMIPKGAFTKTIQERGPQRFLVLDAHQTDSALRVVGKCLDAREVGRSEIPDEILSRYPDLVGALKVKTQYLLDTPEGLGVFLRKKAGALHEMSIGYDAVETEWISVKVKKTGDGYEKNDEGQETRIRVLKQIRLHEYSPVPFGMNAATATVGVKDREGEDDEDEDKKTPVAYQNLPIAPRDTKWSGSGARARIAEWAGGEKINWSKYRKAFLWYDAEKAETAGGYKYPIADVIDGTLTVVPKGVFAAAASLQGGRTPTTIPEGDQGAMKTHLDKYYSRMAKEFDDDSIAAPWKKVKAFSLTDLIEDICSTFREQYHDTYVREVWSEFLICGSYAYGDMECRYYQVGFTFDTDGTVVFDPPSKWVEGKYVFQPLEAPATQPSEPVTEEGSEQMGKPPAPVVAPVSAEVQQLREQLQIVNAALITINDIAAKVGITPITIQEPAEKPKVGPEPPPTNLERERLLLLARAQTEAS